MAEADDDTTPNKSIATNPPTDPEQAFQEASEAYRRDTKTKIAQKDEQLRQKDEQLRREQAENFGHSTIRRIAAMCYFPAEIEVTPASPPITAEADRPVGGAEADRLVGAGAWIADEIRRMKAAGEIRDGNIHGKLRFEVAEMLGFEGNLTAREMARLDTIRITDFAKLLAKRLQKAADTDKSLRVVLWRYIKTQLPTWGFWPLSSIK